MEPGEGIFTDNSVAEDKGLNLVEGWEKKQKQLNPELDRITAELMDAYGEKSVVEGDLGEPSLGEIVDEEKQAPAGMGTNDLMTKQAQGMDEEIRKSNTILGSYGSIAVNKLAGRGADPVTDKKVVDMQVEEMEGLEREFKKTGNVRAFYDACNEEFNQYRRGQNSIVGVES